MLNKLKRNYFRNLVEPLNDIKILEAKLLIDQIKEKGKLSNIQEAEFRVFSQFGDDGIIQYIINRIKLSEPLRTFIEFGVSDYTESNTRFLLMNNNWSGLVMDASEKNIDYIKSDPIFWKHSLKSICKFVNTKNINKIISDQNFSNELGLLHIDIDGNDYWIWKSLNIIKPIIVIIEFNSVFGYEKAVCIPYKENFFRTKAHYSNLYWGASLKALYELAKHKGYDFIGTNSAGNNAYFIRKDYSKFFSVKSCQAGYTESRYRESRDKNGNLSYLSGKERLRAIKNMTVIDVITNKKIKLSELL